VCRISVVTGVCEKVEADRKCNEKAAETTRLASYSPEEREQMSVTEGQDDETESDDDGLPEVTCE
jgi:hypothetical protein